VSAPSSRDILAILINLLADQEGVEIKYELEETEDVRRVSKVAV
jgi:hypothetical protein